MLIVHDPIQILAIAIGNVLPDDAEVQVQYDVDLGARFLHHPDFPDVVLVAANAPLPVVLRWTVEAVASHVTDGTEVGQARSKNLQKAIIQAYHDLWDGDRPGVPIVA